MQRTSPLVDPRRLLYHEAMPSTQRRVTSLLVLAIVIALGALSVSIVALVSRATSYDQPRSGLYVNGPTDEPHYVLALDAHGQGRVSGSLDYVYQDGQTSVVFTFKGTSATSNSSPLVGLMTLQPILVPASDSTSSPAPPSALSAVYGAKGLSLGECSAYLQVTSLAQCQFSYSTVGSI